MLPTVWCALLPAAGLALGRRAGVAIAFVALGALNAQLRWIEPREALSALDLRRPVEVVARLSGHPQHRDGELVARVRTLHLSQGVHPIAARLDVWLTMPSKTYGQAGAPSFGSLIRFKGYLRRSARFANTPHASPGAWRMRLKSARFLRLESSAGAGFVAASRLRRRLERAIDEAREHAGGLGGGTALVRALVLGDRTQLPLVWQQVLRRLGLSHLLAVSGLHVGLLALTAYGLAQPLPRGARYGATLVAVLVYLLLIGPRPAILRASLMGLLAFGSLLAHRPPQSLNGLAWSVFLLVAPVPSVVTELGFQLSFAATAAIVVLAPRYTGAWRFKPKWLRQSLAVSVAAQIATLPLLLPVTGSVHPLAAFFNLVAIPWLSLFLLLAFPWLVLALISAPAAVLLSPALDALASGLDVLARSSPGPLDLRLVYLGPVLAWGFCLAAAWLALRPRHLAAALLALLLIAQAGAPRRSAGPVELTVFDVGQGDAILLRDGTRALLVDGGGWRRGDLAGRVLLPALAAAGVGRLDAVLMTHGDADHCGGLADLLRYLPVSQVWTAPQQQTVAAQTVAAQTVPVKTVPAESCQERLLAAPGPEHRTVVRGDELHLGRWELRVLHPAAESPEGSRRRKANDGSVVVMARYGPRCVLLTGDVRSRRPPGRARPRRRRPG